MDVGVKESEGTHRCRACRSFVEEVFLRVCTNMLIVER